MSNLCYMRPMHGTKMVSYCYRDGADITDIICTEAGYVGQWLMRGSVERYKAEHGKSPSSEIWKRMFHDAIVDAEVVLAHQYEAP